MTDVLAFTVGPVVTCLKIPVAHHGWATKKILRFSLSKTASTAILEAILFAAVAIFIYQIVVLGNDISR